MILSRRNISVKHIFVFIPTPFIESMHHLLVLLRYVNNRTDKIQFDQMGMLPLLNKNTRRPHTDSGSKPMYFITDCFFLVDFHVPLTFTSYKKVT